MSKKMLDLFAGTRSVSRAFEKAGWETYSVEWDKKFKDISLYADISQLTADDILKLCGGRPDVIWASPDCSSYSVAAISHHREKIGDTLAPKTEYAKFCDMTNKHVLDLIEQLSPKYFFIENPPTSFKISNKCCHHSKKVTAHQFNVDNDIDVVIMGLRRYEGGVRGMSISKCYNPGRKGSHNGQFVPDKYYPIFWLTDADKAQYDQYYRIKNSDCYTKYGFTRTGCACCPYGLDCEIERSKIKTFEPKIYKLTERVFGKSYDYTRKFYEFRQQHDLDKKRGQNTQLDRWL